ncbi:MAG: hypothetical protein LBL81_00285 [Tannerella sp.]|jgi:dipeptidyl aminopeptidase/acylaminoacyl peptidase|nr:hypothetical protein [Tannerella sp.]
MSYKLAIIWLLPFLCACGRIKLPETVAEAHRKAEMFPDYAGVTVPPNIAPLDFAIAGRTESLAFFAGKSGKPLRVEAPEGAFRIPLKAWRRLLRETAGDSVRVTLYEHAPDGWLRYAPFSFFVSTDSIDGSLVYRRIAPGYRMWGSMGIYRRDLESFKEETLIANKQTDHNCMNCHSFCMESPDKMLFHQRAAHAGTYLMEDGKLRQLHPQPDTVHLTYPYWHPSGKFIAFSSNVTHQDFHLADANRIEVYDVSSDIYLYDCRTQQLTTDSLLSSPKALETFPAFSPDGKRLYFCSAKAYPMPESYRKMKYSLLSIPVDAAPKTFGSAVDTLYNARTQGRSVSFPRVSPDGRFLLYTLFDYGNFSIWHKEADLRLLDLATLRTDSLPGVNSPDVESYHSWSSNSRWFVFSSRRIDGLYTRPFLCHIDKNGKTSKPFLLPQKEPDYYLRSLYSFNIPELVRKR